MFLKKIFIGSLSVILCSIIFCTSYIRDNPHQKASKDTYNNKSLPTIIIDAGHGGEDSGAISAEGVYEKDINLSISITLDKLLRLNGFKTQMIRTEDKSVHTIDFEKSTLRERKVSDIHKRVDIANADKENILISIHQNHFSETKYNGTQIFYSKNNYKSKTLAESIRISVISLIQQNNKRENKESHGIYLLDHTDIPSVIVECGFLSNPQEASLLNQKNYQNDMAYCIFLGILEYCYQNY